MYDLVKRKGIYYKKFSDISFTGKITGNPQGEFKNGKREDAWSFFNKNGQLNTKGNYKNGKEEGSWVWYDENGTIITELLTGTYKDGKRISD